ncbi:MAG: LamB/YcsF family protein [Gemmobacter sp.]
MIGRIDLNADMGEGFGPWQMGADAALLDIVTSANIACGMHAGDWDTMARTMAVAAQRGVGIGAHPGFPDIQGFGRRRMDLPLPSVANLVRYQLGAAQAMAKAAGAQVRHLKLHGALANMASLDEALAHACYEGALSVDPEVIIMVIAGTAQERAARRLGCRAACEIFADRAYAEDATLLDRRLPGAVLHDPAAICDRVLAMLEAEAILTAEGSRIPARIDTICLHGDTPEAVDIARTLRAGLERAGVALQRFDGGVL